MECRGFRVLHMRCADAQARTTYAQARGVCSTRRLNPDGDISNCRQLRWGVLSGHGVDSSRMRTTYRSLLQARLGGRCRVGDRTFAAGDAAVAGCVRRSRRGTATGRRLPRAAARRPSREHARRRHADTDRPAFDRQATDPTTTTGVLEAGPPDSRHTSRRPGGNESPSI